MQNKRHRFLTISLIVLILTPWQGFSSANPSLYRSLQIIECARAFSDSQYERYKNLNKHKTRPSIKDMTSEETEKVIDDFLSALANRNSTQINSLIATYPFLIKNFKMRFDPNKVIKDFPEEYRQWGHSKGFGIIQLAVFLRNDSILENLLNAVDNLRSMTSLTNNQRILESNPLHIAIKTGYENGVDMILRKRSEVLFINKKTNKRNQIRLVNEKDENYLTPFTLAVLGAEHFYKQNDSSAYDTMVRILKRILKAKPYGKVKVPVYIDDSIDNYVLMNGLALVKYIGIEEISQLAQEHLDMSEDSDLFQKYQQQNSYIGIPKEYKPLTFVIGESFIMGK